MKVQSELKVFHAFCNSTQNQAIGIRVCRINTNVVQCSVSKVLFNKYLKLHVDGAISSKKRKSSENKQLQISHKFCAFYTTKFAFCRLNRLQITSTFILLAEIWLHFIVVLQTTRDNTILIANLSQGKVIYPLDVELCLHSVYYAKIIVHNCFVFQISKYSRMENIYGKCLELFFNIRKTIYRS